MIWQWQWIASIIGRNIEEKNQIHNQNCQQIPAIKLDLIQSSASHTENRLETILYVNTLSVY